MQFSFNNVLISEEEIAKTAKTLDSYLKHLRKVSQEQSYDYDESSINLAFDEQTLNRALKLKEELVSDKLKYFINVGIGGSNLGTKAIYDSLHGYFDVLEPERHPKMIFADTIDPEYLKKLESLLNQLKFSEQVLVNAISKSGTTTESVVNLEIILSVLARKDSSAQDRLIVTTDEGSKLWNKAQEKNVKTLLIPKKVGGRFSVLSSVGLFPLLAVGVDVKKLLSGARELRNLCLGDNVGTNPALASAVILFLHSEKGIKINDNFLFHPELESLGKWYRQLMGESIGKQGLGITPTVSVGSTDLHSLAQLYLGGPKDKLTTLVYTDKFDQINIPQSLIFDGLVENIESKKAGQIMQAIFEGVKASYINKGLPFMEVIFKSVDEYSLGQFLQFKMMEMMFLGKLLGVDAFDQPNVEEYKTETRKILKSYN